MVKKEQTKTKKVTEKMPEKAPKRVRARMPEKRRSTNKIKAWQVKSNKKYLILGISAGAVLILLVILAILNYTTIRDFLVGMRYRPSAEMSQIRTDLDLTDAGMRIFNASQPELMEKAEFNQKCREIENESAILGCYTEEKVYVYNIVDDELPGIRELATAHELLHAVYARMSDADKISLVEPLTRVFDENQKFLEKEINIYPVEQKQEELYVRAGTEIKDLPEALEKHYAQYFKDQDKIVDFYESYITVFREIETKLSKLLDKINSLQDEINTKTASYEAGVESLNAKIKEFNECANTLNCFASTAIFNSKRAGLLSEQNGLKAVYNEINSLISRCNELIKEYNENILHGQILNMRINSSANVEEVKD